MMPQMKPALETDRGAIDGVLEAVWDTDHTAQSYFRPRLGVNPAFVALVKDRVIGFSSVRGNAWHPTRDYVGVNVHPAFQARGIGKALFAALEAVLVARGKALQTATMETQPRAKPWLEALGFSEIMRTFTPVFDPRAIHLEPFQSAFRRIEKSGLELRSLAELGRSRELEARLVRLHHTIYRDTHTWNPTAEMTPEDALETFMGQDLIPEAMFVSLQDGEPVGVSSLRGDSELELAWFGLSPSHQELGMDVPLALVGQCLEYARRIGATNMSGEFDSLDPTATLVLETLRIERGAAWLTFQRDAARDRPER